MFVAQREALGKEMRKIQFGEIFGKNHDKLQTGITTIL
jgi:hypothetical protein